MDINLTEKLKHYFGFDTFKGEQEAIIRNLLAGNDTFVLMPTGGGKSLCYQLPSLIMDGTAIVISPLIALMKNQVDVINGISEHDGVAHCLNSSMNKTAIDQVKRDVKSGVTKLLYMAPESLTKEEYVTFLRDVRISFYAVDEAHCISEWGHDFRPEYRRIRPIVDEIGVAPVIALTATATEKVRADIKKSLGITEAKDFMSSFNRPSLYYEVRTKTSDIDKQIIKFVRQHPGKSGIIYCLARKKVEELAEVLKTNDIKAAPYHAGLDNAVRNQTQDDFLMERIDVIVATIAFGMGIDKPDVRFVIHYDIPKSLEGYYQETGRAGRDGGEGICIAFYSQKDLQKLEKFMDSKQVAEQEIGRHLLQETAAYAESSICRRKMLLKYFGEDYPKDNCGNCDNCRHPKKKIEAANGLAAIITAVTALKENYRSGYVFDFIKGRSTDDIESHKHHILPDFGCGEGMNDRLWNPILRQAIVEGYIKKDIETYGNLKVTEAGKRWMKNRKPFYVTEDNNYNVETVETPSVGGALDPTLFAMLKELRKTEARRHKVQPYIVFMEGSLEQMATMYPVTLQELQNIQGVGQGKARRYGQPFCDLIKRYCEENDIVRPEDIRVRSVAKNSMRKVKIVQCIDRKMPLDDIAKSMGMKFDELIDELEAIVYSGTKLNINYYIEDSMYEEQIDDIYDYFAEAETDSLKEAYDEFSGDYSDEDIRLIRLMYISEKAN
ncbi:MAG: DNA helicase RecQ [Prevotellaceae bacterium]|nr:DNA helicase RecQ [Prevotellaceae bacterium]